MSLLGGSTLLHNMFHIYSSYKLLLLSEKVHWFPWQHILHYIVVHYLYQSRLPFIICGCGYISNYDVIFSSRWSSLFDCTGDEMSLCSGLVSIVVTDKNMLGGVYKLGEPHPLPHPFILHLLNLSIILFSNL